MDEPAARLPEHQDVMERVIARLPSADLARFAAVNKAMAELVQVPLAIRHLSADVFPANNPTQAAHTLTISTSRFYWGPAAATSAACFLLPRLPHLLSLTLSLADLEEARLAAIITACTTLRTLTHLAITHAALFHTGAEALVDLLPCLSRLAHLSLGDSFLSDYSATALVPALAHTPALTTLDLNGNALALDTLQRVLRGCRATCPHLRSLRLARCDTNTSNAFLRPKAACSHLSFAGDDAGAVGGLGELHLDARQLDARGGRGGTLRDFQAFTELRGLHVHHHTQGFAGISMVLPQELALLTGLTGLSLPVALARPEDVGSGSGRRVDEDLAAVLSALRGLQHLSLTAAQMRRDSVADVGGALHAIGRLSGLTYLTVGQWVPDSHMGAQGPVLAGLTRLRFLQLGLQVSLEGDVPLLGGLVHMTCLMAGLCGDAGAVGNLEDVLRRMRGLRELQLEWVEREPACLRLDLLHAVVDGCLSTVRLRRLSPHRSGANADAAAPPVAVRSVRQLAVVLGTLDRDELNCLGLEALPRLSSLALHACEANPADAAAPFSPVWPRLAALHGLRDLVVCASLNSRGAVAELARSLVRLTQLTMLHLNDRQGVEAHRGDAEAAAQEWIGVLARLSRLQALRMHGLASLDCATLHGVAGLSALTFLDLDSLVVPGCDWAAAGVQEPKQVQFEQLTALERLAVTYADPRRTIALRSRTPGAAWLAGLTQLTALSLHEVVWEREEADALLDVAPLLTRLKTLTLHFRVAMPMALVSTVCGALRAVTSLGLLELYVAVDQAERVEMEFRGKMQPWFNLRLLVV